jgi:hypothetical protein
MGSSGSSGPVSPTVAPRDFLKLAVIGKNVADWRHSVRGVRVMDTLWNDRSRQIVLQKSKVAAVPIFGEKLKRKEVDDSHSLSRATEVAHEFGARR